MAESKRGAVAMMRVVKRAETLRFRALADGRVELTNGARGVARPLVATARGTQLDVTPLDHPTTQLELRGAGVPEFRLFADDWALSRESVLGILAFIEVRRDMAYDILCDVSCNEADSAISAASGEPLRRDTLNLTRIRKLELVFPAGTAADALDGAELVQTLLAVEAISNSP